MSRSVEIAAAVGGIALAGIGAAPFLHRIEPPDRWMQLHWPRDLDEDAVRALLRHLASTRRPALLTFEARSRRGRVRHYVGTANTDVERVRHAFATFLPEVLLEDVAREPLRLFVALQLRLATRERPLRTDDATGVSQSVIGALAGTTGTTVLQYQLGARLAPMHVPNDTTGLPTSARAVGQAFRYGLAPLDAADRRNLQSKVGTQGYRAVLRVATNISEPAVGKGALRAVIGGLRTAEAPGAHLTVRSADPRAVESAVPRRRFPVALNIDELVGILGWPLGDIDYPGIIREGARRLPVPTAIAKQGRVLGVGAHPATRRPVALDARDGLMHTHVIGPTGTGKSTLLAQIAIDTITTGNGLVVIEPKSDLVADILDRIPAKRERDVVILPGDQDAPVGLNPLAGGPPDLVSDQVMAVLRGLYGDALGPRSADVIHAALLTLARSEDATLVALPLLLTDTRLRRELTRVVRDDLALGPFWSWYEGISDDARAQVIAPVMNKLRPFILRESVRHVLGQPRPRFDITEVFTDRKILLVPLAKGTIGEGAAGLLGSLAVARLWRAAQSRSRLAPDRRTPVTMIIDEFQDFLHLPTDLADVLAQARGLGLGLVLAHQHLAQLTPSVRAALLANARSRVVFRLGADDAATLARTTPLLDANDFQALPRYEAYASIVATAETQPYCSIATRPLAAPSNDPERLRAMSRERYGVPSVDIEQHLRSLAYDNSEAEGGTVGSRRRKRPTAPDGDGAQR